MAQQSTRLSLSACSIGNSVTRQLGPPWPIATASAPGICLIQSSHWLSHPTACPAGALTSARKTPCGWPIRPSFSCDDDSTSKFHPHTGRTIPLYPSFCQHCVVVRPTFCPPQDAKTRDLKDEHISCMHHYGTRLVTNFTGLGVFVHTSKVVMSKVVRSQGSHSLTLCSVLSALSQWRGTGERLFSPISTANRTKTKDPVTLLTTDIRRRSFRCNVVLIAVE